MRRGRKLLSARRLDDVPASVRIGSPHDAPDSLVYRLAKRGILHPQTNFGVIYRVAFAPAMKQGEQPAQGGLTALPVEGMSTSLVLRFGWVVPPERFSDSGKEFEVSERDFETSRLGAWVLLTTDGIRWHYTVDGAPQIRAGIGAGLGGGVRLLPYRELQQWSMHDHVPLPVSGRDVDIDWFVFDALETFYAFGLAGASAPENLRWYDFIREQAGTVRDM